MIILGTLCLLAGTATGFVGLMGLSWGGRNDEVLTWLGTALFTFGGGMGLLFMAEDIRRHRRWALYAGIVVTMLFMIVLEVGFPLLFMADWPWEVLGIGLLALLLFGVLLLQLFQSRRAIRLHEMGATRF